VWALLVVIGAAPAAADPPRLRIEHGWVVLQDCSTGPSLSVGARFALIDHHGWRGEVVTAQRTQVYDGCGGADGWTLSPEVGDPYVGMMLVGPLPPGQRLRHARVVSPVPRRRPAREGAHLARVFRAGPPAPGFEPFVRVDLDGDGSVDAELGLLVCDHRSGPDEVRRLRVNATRLRAARAWRFSDVERSGGLESPEWPATVPYSFCPFEPPAPETEIAPEARYEAVPVPRGEGLRR
jgi:hypothetical protein